MYMYYIIVLLGKTTSSRQRLLCQYWKLTLHEKVKSTFESVFALVHTADRHYFCSAKKNVRCVYRLSSALLTMSPYVSFFASCHAHQVRAVGVIRRRTQHVELAARSRQ